MIQTQSEKELKCLEHNEQAIFIDFSMKDTHLQNRCLKCVGREMQLWVDVQEADKHLENVKRTVWNERQVLHQKNLENLQELSGQLKQLKITFNSSLDKTLLNIDQQIQFIQNGMKKENKSIIELSMSHLDQFQSRNSSQQLLYIDYLELQSFYRDQIKRLKMDQSFIQLEENIKKIEFSEKCSIQEIIETFSSEICHSSRLFNQNWICENHKLQVAVVDLNEQVAVPNRLACIDCVTEYPIQYTKLEQLKQFWLNYVEKTLKYQEQQQIHLNEKASKAILKLSTYREVITDLTQELTQVITLKEVVKCQATQNLINLKTKNWCQLNKQEIIEISNLISKKNKYEIINDAIRNEFLGQQIELKKNFLNSFKIFKEKLLGAFQQIYEEILVGLNTADNDIQSNSSIEENSVQIESQLLLMNDQNSIKTPFQYELINSIKDERIEAFAFNDDYTLLAAGYYGSNKIKIYEFNKGYLKTIQELTDHQECIYCLKFFKKTTQFMSGSFDKTIIIWEKNNNNQWDLKFRLNGHVKGIFCLGINNIENQIISGSSDKSIKVWDKDKEWQCCQTLSVHTNSVTSISLSQSNEYLVSCAQKEDQILIFKFQGNSKLWILFQTIKIDFWGMKVCFLDNLAFAFQPFNNVKMYTFQKNDQNDQFIQTSNVEVKAGDKCYPQFPLQFIEQKQMIVDRNGSKVNLIRKQENGSYVTQFVIDYEADRIFGTMTEDGQYLITWDKKNQQIQIRQYKE